MITNKNEYLICPCKVSSIPYWKATSITVPDGMCIVHQDNFNIIEYQHYIDEPYFRLIHSLQDLSIQVLPQGYSLCNATLKDFSEHINSCYNGIGVTEADLRDYPHEWLPAQCNSTRRYWSLLPRYTAYYLRFGLQKSDVCLCEYRIARHRRRVETIPMYSYQSSYTTPVLTK